MINSVTIEGRLTKDPEYGHTSNQTEYANLTLACSRPFKDSNGQATADFIRCIAWQYVATYIQRKFHKGDLVVVHGRLQTSTYDNDMGEKCYSTQVVISEIDGMSIKKDEF